MAWWGVDDAMIHILGERACPAAIGTKKAATESGDLHGFNVRPITSYVNFT